jgi:serine/threonine protein phosphatase PrpC
MELAYAQATDCGRVRDHNEDYIGCVEGNGWLFVLADGVGGQDKGEVASRTAVETMLAEFGRAPRDQPLRSLLPKLVQTANEKVFEAGLAAGSPGKAMATTIVACGLRFDRAVVAHVGDSRCYLIRGGRANALTRDHTMAGQNVLTRSLGNEMFVSADMVEQTVGAGDVLLLCSDGLHGAISAEEIAAIMSGNQDLEEAAWGLIDAANERGGPDNVSVQLIRVVSVERVGMYRGRPYKIEEESE